MSEGIIETKSIGGSPKFEDLENATLNITKVANCSKEDINPVNMSEMSGHGYSNREHLE